MHYTYSTRNHWVECSTGSGEGAHSWLLLRRLYAMQTLAHLRERQSQLPVEDFRTLLLEKLQWLRARCQISGWEAMEPYLEGLDELIRQAVGYTPASDILAALDQWRQRFMAFDVLPV